MNDDGAEGWETIAEQFMAVRSDVGAQRVRSWAVANLPAGASIIDVGCGSGVPIAQALIESGYDVFGSDASPTLVTAFRGKFPKAHCICERAQDGSYFDRTFDAAIAIGLLFLVSEDDQRRVIARVARALVSGGQFLFSAPREVCDWQDTLTGRRSLSLGRDEYERLLQASGLALIGCYVDEGDNNYYYAVKAVS